jgi:hypothetical protein
MMGIKQKLKTGLEVDVIYARKRYCYLCNNIKLVRFAKKQLSRRRRKERKKSVQYTEYEV